MLHCFKCPKYFLSVTKVSSQNSSYKYFTSLKMWHAFLNSVHWKLPDPWLREFSRISCSDLPSLHPEYVFIQVIIQKISREIESVQWLEWIMGSNLHRGDLDEIQGRSSLL